jgi:signal transduction histidine kinase
MSAVDAGRDPPRGVPLIAGTALVMGLVVIPAGITSEVAEPRGIWAVFGPLIGWAFVGVGLYALVRPPSRRFGELLIATGLTWFLGIFSLFEDPLLWAIGQLLGTIWLCVLVHALLAFPSGRLGSRAQRVVVGCMYAAFVVLAIPTLLVLEDPAETLDCDICPTSNPLAVTDSPDIVDIVGLMRAVLILGGFAAVFVILARRWRRASPAQRRSLAPVLFTGLTLGVVFVVGGLLSIAFDIEGAWNWAVYACMSAVPFAFLLGLARSHLYRTGAVTSLVERLGGRLGADELREALAQALSDPTLELAFWLPEQRRYVDAEGSPVQLPEEGSGRAATPIEHDGRQIAALIHSDALSDEPELVRGVGKAASLALLNERLEAELTVRLDELHSSRERLMSAGDSERRKLERDLHDGAQQRFVALALRLRLARAQLPEDAPAAALLDTALEELTEGLKELRELARGIHPAILTDQGLHAALRGLVSRAPVPVEVVQLPEQRLPPPVETAAYFLIAEALTNVAKYAQATKATVSVVQDDGHAVVEICDDGVGGADPKTGSGLRGLSDRIEALHGDLELLSPPGEGTTLRARMPIQPTA